MKRILHNVTLLLVACLSPLAVQAQSDKPEEGKVYLINRNTNTNAYHKSISTPATTNPGSKSR